MPVRSWEWVSGVNRRGEPFIQLVKIIDGKRELMGQLAADELRELCANGLQAAEAAETDAFLVGYFRERLKLGDAQMAGVLADFRDYRAELGHSEPVDPEHWSAVMDEIAKEKTGKSFDPTKKQ